MVRLSAFAAVPMTSAVGPKVVGLFVSWLVSVIDRLEAKVMMFEPPAALAASTAARSEPATLSALALTT